MVRLENYMKKSPNRIQECINALALMVFLFASPVSAQRYFVATAFDTEGLESEYSNEVEFSGGVGAVTFEWSPNSEPDLAGYRLWCSKTSGGPYVQAGDPIACTAADATCCTQTLAVEDPQTIELAKLYSWEFYIKVRSILEGDGIIVTQATSPYYAKEVFLCILRTIEAAGFKTIPYQGFVGSFGGNWGWIIGHLFSEDEIQFRLTEFDQMNSFRIETRYLLPNMFRSLRIFGKDDLIAEKYPNTINYLTTTPTLDVIYESSWKKI